MEFSRNFKVVKAFQAIYCSITIWLKSNQQLKPSHTLFTEGLADLNAAPSSQPYFTTHSYQLGH